MDTVQEWLTSLSLQDYCEVFMAEGWDDLETVKTMSEDDVKSIVTKPGHVRKINMALDKLKNDTTEKCDEMVDRHGHANRIPIQSPNVRESQRHNEAISRREHRQMSARHLGVTCKDLNPYRMQKQLVQRNGESEDSSGSSSSAEEDTTTSSEGSDDERSIVRARPDQNVEMKAGIMQLSQSNQMLVESGTVVKDSKNVTIARNVQIINEERKNTKTNFEAQMEACLETYRKQVFVKTRAYIDSTDAIEDQNWVTIVGNPGDGKSAIAHQLLLDYSAKGYSVLELSSPSEWKKLVYGKNVKSNKQIVLLDDIFGVSSVDENAVNRWQRSFQSMANVVDFRKGNLKVICTTRKVIHNQVKDRLNRDRYKQFRPSTVVDLTSKPLVLSKEERLSILDKYFFRYAISFPKYEMEKVASIDLNYGFPHSVEMYCTNSRVRDKGLKFFEYPLQCVEREIDHLKMQDKRKYCALLLVLLSDQSKISLDKCDDAKLILCLKLSGLHNTIPIYNLIDAFASLENVYLKKELSFYKFKHDSFEEVIWRQFALSFPQHAITLVPLDFLGRIIVGGNKLFTLDLDDLIVLPIDHSLALSERLTQEIINGNLPYVSRSIAWFIPEFQDTWLSYVTNSKSTSENLLEKCVTKKFNIIQNEEINMLACLAVNKHERLISNILSSDAFRSTIDLSIRRKVCSITLLVSTYRGLSTSLLQSLLECGADINYSCQYEFSYLMWWPDREIPLPHYTPLMCSVSNGNYCTTQFLLRNGANVFCGFPLEGDTVISLAVKNSDVYTLTCLLEYINNIDNSPTNLRNNKEGNICITHLRDINHVSFFCNAFMQGHSIFFTHAFTDVRDTDCLKALIKFVGNDLVRIHHNIKYCTSLSMRQTNPLYSLYCWGEVPNEKFVEMAQLLLDLPIDINAQDSDGMTLLHYLCNYGPDTMSLNKCHLPMKIIDISDCNMRDNDGCVPLFYALQHCNTIDENYIASMIKKTDISITDVKQRSCFHFLAKSKYSSIIAGVTQMLKNEGLDINQPDSDGYLPLYMCSCVEVMKIYIDSGAKPEFITNNGHDMLVACLVQSEEDIESKFRLLLTMGVGFHDVDDSCRDILFYLSNSKLSFNEKKDVFQLLVDHNMDPLKAAQGTKHIIQWLEGQNCDLEFLQYIVSRTGHVDCSTDDFSNLLHHLPLNDNVFKTGLSILRSMGLLNDTERLRMVLNVLVKEINPKAFSEVINSVDLADLPLEEVITVVVSSEREDKEKVELLQVVLDLSTETPMDFRFLSENIKCRISLFFCPLSFQLFERCGLQFDSLKIEDTSIFKDFPKKAITDATEFYLSKRRMFRRIFSDNILVDLAFLLAEKGIPKTVAQFFKLNQMTIPQSINKDGNNLLHILVENIGQDGESSYLEEICLQEALLQMRNASGQTPLCIACSKADPNFKVIQILLQSGSDIVYEHPNGNSPLLDLFVSFSFSDTNADVAVGIVSLMLQRNINLQKVDDVGLTPTMTLGMLAGSGDTPRKVLQFLFTHLSSVDEKDPDGKSLLHYVAMSGMSDESKVSLANILIERGISVNTKDNEGNCAIDETCLSLTPSIKLCEVLSVGVDINCVAKCLIHNIEQCDFELSANYIIDVLKRMNIPCNWKDSTGLTFLSVACRQLDKGLVKELLHCGADPNIQNGTIESPVFSTLLSQGHLILSYFICLCYGLDFEYDILMQTNNIPPWPRPAKGMVNVFGECSKGLALGRSYLSFHDVVIQRINDELEILQLLLKHGTNPNQVDREGKTPLHYCTQAPYLDDLVCPWMEILIKYGADVNFEDFEGTTPIMSCAAFTGPKSRRMNILIKSGADLLQRDYTGRGISDYTKIAAGNAYLESVLVMEFREQF